MDQRDLFPTPPARRPRGKLALLKCEPCRRDKQKCEPQVREWPQKCHRCELKGFHCSPNTRKHRARRRGPGHGRPVILAEPGNITTPMPYHTQDEYHEQSIETEPPDADPEVSTWPSTIVDFSNAVSALAVFKRALFRHSKWISTHNDIFLKDDMYGISISNFLEGDLLPHQFRQDISDFYKSITDVLKSRLESIASGSSAIPEQLALRGLLYEAIEIPNFSTSQLLSYNPLITLLGSSYQDHTTYSDPMSRVTGPSAVDVGMSLLRHDRILEGLSSRHDAEPNTIIDFIEDSFLMQARFRDAYLRMETQVSFDALGWTTLSLSENCRPIVFDSQHWMQLIDSEQHWQKQDFLGTSILHLILENLEHDFPRARYLRIKPHVRQNLVRKIGLHVSPSHPVDRFGRTLLHVAAQYGLEDVLHALLSLGMDCNATTMVGSTALHYAAALGSLGVCKSLLNHGVGFNLKDKLGFTALHYAALNRHVDVVELLLSQQDISDSIAARNHLGHTPLMIAITSDDLTYKAFFDHPDVDITVTDEDGDTVLHLAVDDGRDLAIGDLTVMAGVSVNQANGEGDTALHWACQKTYNAAAEEIVKILLRNPHLDAGIENARGITPLWLAARAGYLEVCRLLGMRVDSGLLVACPLPWDSSTALTPQEIAALEGHQDVVDLLSTFEGRITGRVGVP
ncbi:ankyrin repeat-containing domain protein [Podospora aff. communis PSN243]|uniref:Ankyrin repeat-containing domain protein n=1 Tax=Podospora aff. communis PSN243 TaxID=3040156 RepID=A0AAV9G869_9PEZI|nr:ankyrin repeat-containing domain protein [Podospora aff. communis PSN243]